MKQYIAAATIVAVTASAVATPVQAVTYKISKGKLVNAKTGKIVTKTTVFKNKLYQKGVLAKGTVLYKKKLYVKGVLAKEFKLYKDTLYENGKVHKGVKPYKNQLYVDGVAHPLEYTFVYDGVLHLGAGLYQGEKIHDGILYKNGYPYTGVYTNNTYYVDGKKTFDGVINDAQVSVEYKSDTSAVVHISGLPATIKFDSPLTKITPTNSYRFIPQSGHLGELEFTFNNLQSSSAFSVTIDTLYYGVGRESLTFNNKTFSFKPLLQLKAHSDFAALYNDLEKLKNLKNNDNAKWFVTEHDAINSRATKYDQLFGNNGSTASTNPSLYYAAHYLYTQFAQLKDAADKTYIQ